MFSGDMQRADAAADDAGARARRTANARISAGAAKRVRWRHAAGGTDAYADAASVTSTGGIGAGSARRRLAARGRAVVGVLMVSVVLLVAGCASSAPVRFYTLSAVGAGGGAVEAAGGVGAIRLGRVRIPAELDRNEIVQRIDANRLTIGEFDRWAAPLDDMIRRVLTADLQARTGPLAPGQTPATLSLDIEDLMGDSTCAVTLTASWELKTPPAPSAKANPTATTEPVTTGTTSTGTTSTGTTSTGTTAAVATGREVIRIASSSGSCPASALPAPISQALAQLADKIATHSQPPGD